MQALIAPAAYTVEWNDHSITARDSAHTQLAKVFFPSDASDSVKAGKLEQLDAAARAVLSLAKP